MVGLGIKTSQLSIFYVLGGHILIISSISMGTCMLSKTHIDSSRSAGDELTTSVRSQIRS